MTSPSRDAVAAALLARISAATFSTPINGRTAFSGSSSRRLVLWGELSDNLKPAAYLVFHREQYGQARGGASRGIPPRRIWQFAVFCYFPAPKTPATVGDRTLDVLMAAIEAALVPDDPGRNVLSLGGLLPDGYARIEGDVFRDPGDLDGQGLLIVPVRVLVP